MYRANFAETLTILAPMTVILWKPPLVLRENPLPRRHSEWQTFDFKVTPTGEPSAQEIPSPFPPQLFRAEGEVDVIM